MSQVFAALLFGCWKDGVRRGGGKEGEKRRAVDAHPRERASRRDCEAAAFAAEASGRWESKAMMLPLLLLLGVLVCGCHAALQVSISLNKVELSVGESKFFICTAIGEPVRLDWYSPQGERIMPSKRMALHSETSRSRLIIYNAIIEDAGIYRCQATDANGRTEEASVVLEIYQRLTFRDVQSPQEFRRGETAEVVCDVISSPVPVVVWYYQDREITEEHHSRFQVLPNNNLQIHQVSKADEGVYRCEASVEARGEIDFVDIAVVVNV
ncbi:neural cell adhesion molecule 2 [Neosynchiropus ocellatus]